MPFVYTVLVGIVAVTDRVKVTTGVTCPTVRYHPGIVTQMAETSTTLLEGRFALGIGSGENQPVSQGQLQDVLGNLSGPLMAMLPALLPMVIDKLTPDGQVPQGGLGNGNDLLGMLTKAMAQRS